MAWPITATAEVLATYGTDHGYFGHVYGVVSGADLFRNDQGEIDNARARGDLAGTGDQAGYKV